LSRRIWLVGALLVVPVISDIIASTAALPVFWAQFLPNLYYAAIVVAGLEYGWKAGLSLAIFSAVSHALVDTIFLSKALLQLEASTLAFLIVGFAFFERRRSSTELPPPAVSARIGNGNQAVSQLAEVSSELLREVRTPFASIEGAAYLLEESGSNFENQKEFVEIIRNECRRVNRILTEIEQSTNIIPLHMAAVDPATLLSEVVRQAALAHPDPAIKLRIDVSPELPPLWCDAAQVEQSIVPFVTSAMSGMGSGGEFLLAAHRENGHARIQLRIIGQSIQATDPVVGRGKYSATFDASCGVRVVAARRTIMQHGGTVVVEQSGHIKRISSLTLPLYNGQTS
jgi:signal transduction histidine kinase